MSGISKRRTLPKTLSVYFKQTLQNGVQRKACLKKQSKEVSRAEAPQISQFFRKLDYFLENNKLS